MASDEPYAHQATAFDLPFASADQPCLAPPPAELAAGVEEDTEDGVPVGFKRPRGRPKKRPGQPTEQYFCRRCNVPKKGHRCQQQSDTNIQSALGNILQAHGLGHLGPDAASIIARAMDAASNLSSSSPQEMANIAGQITATAAAIAAAVSSSLSPHLGSGGGGVEGPPAQPATLLIGDGDAHVPPMPGTNGRYSQYARSYCSNSVGGGVPAQATMQPQVAAHQLGPSVWGGVMQGQQHTLMGRPHRTMMNSDVALAQPHGAPSPRFPTSLSYVGDFGPTDAARRTQISCIPSG